MDSVNKIEYKIRDLGTRSVTLFPTKAQISRQIKDVALKPGANEIIIVGLSPTVDEHSIKVEGTGSAIITDIAVESLPNRESFDDVYPSSDSESETEDSDGDDEKKPEKESPEIQAIDDRISKYRAESQRAQEEVENAVSRGEILEKWSNEINQRKENVNIPEVLGTYKIQRQRIFDNEQQSKDRYNELYKLVQDEVEERARLKKIEQKATASQRKQQRKADRAKEKERAKKAKLALERAEEKQRIRKERENFWPKYCYTVRITLEANAYTPMSSRRNSVSSDVDLAKAAPEKAAGSATSDDGVTCDLLLSYVTTSAYWSPTYDLQLSTTSATGMLCFDAQLRNSTSETWENCRVTLSTTQSTFTGLEDAIPTLQPWHVRLTRHMSPSESDVLISKQERVEREKFISQQQLVHLPKRRNEMFGPPSSQGLGSEHPADYQMQLMLLEQQNKKRMMAARQESSQVPQMQQPQRPYAPGSQVQPAPLQQANMANARGGTTSTINFMQSGSSTLPPPPPAPRMMSKMKKKRAENHLQAASYDEEEEDDDLEVDLDTIVPDTQQTLGYQESFVEETGFTTTYDLPGLKTLAPKSTVSKQRVARINFSNVGLSHIVVAKYRPVAYLKAKLRNGSKMTLLRGPAGLTLDGSFMGRTTLPRCSAGDTFSLSLGVDPAIKVIYSKPDVRRSTTGMFNKENSSVYMRTLTLHNTRAIAGKPVTLMVLDQVPLSEDERLKVHIVSPSGLVVGGGIIAAGKPGRDIKDDKDWGRAAALMKKGGEVTWEVNLNAGKAVKLVLEYAISLPSGDCAVEC